MTDVIIACDFQDKESTLKFLRQFGEEKLYLKIGMELYYAEGPALVKEIKALGHRIFLDLKLHDIPTTVKKAMRVLSRLDVDMVNVHAAGGIEMMAAAREGLRRADGSSPLLIAVTQLTSTSQEMMEKDLLIEQPLENVVNHYARNAKAAGLDGVVCSAHEAQRVHEVCGEDMLTVTPGIRFEEDAKDDQKRIMTPQKARQAGADFMVIGRSITQAENPLEAYRRALKREG